MSNCRGRPGRQDTPGLAMNRALAELVLGPRPGRPTFSTRTGNAIAETFGVSRRTGKSIVHGGLGVGAATYARQHGFSNEASAVVGFLAFLALETYDAA